MTKDEFVTTFRDIYEHSPWVPERAYAMDPPRNLEGIAACFAAVVDSATDKEKLALLRAHPDLAGKLGRQEELTASSTKEQQGAGLNACTDEEFEAFSRLNDAYKEKFGFPFILAVKGWHRTDILKEFKRRASGERDQEFNEALAQVHRIARFRLEDHFEGHP